MDTLVTGDCGFIGSYWKLSGWNIYCKWALGCID